MKSCLWIKLLAAGSKELQIGAGWRTAFWIVLSLLFLAAALAAVLSVILFRMRTRNETRLIDSTEELRISNERYKFISEQSESAVVEVDLLSGEVFCSENYRKIFGRDLTKEFFDSEDGRQSYVESEEYEKILAEAGLCRINRDFRKYEARLCHADGRVLWCKIGMGVICGADGQVGKLIAKITNIDQIKRENERLLTQSRIDPFTQVCNKVYTELAVNDRIRACPNAKSALIVLDLDNFKGINDQFGHLFGDLVLLQVVKLLRDEFPNDIVGRLGGDEFAVFVEDIKDRKIFEEKLADVAARMRTPPAQSECSCRQVTCSMGAACFPKDGGTFKELSRRADLALYDAKFNGKDGYALFDPKKTYPLFKKCAGGISALRVAAYETRLRDD